MCAIEKRTRSAATGRRQHGFSTVHGHDAASGPYPDRQGTGTREISTRQLSRLMHRYHHICREPIPPKVLSSTMRIRRRDRGSGVKVTWNEIMPEDDRKMASYEFQSNVCMNQIERQLDELRAIRSRWAESEWRLQYLRSFTGQPSPRPPTTSCGSGINSRKHHAHPGKHRQQ